MATTTQIEEKPRIIIPRAGRRNEILAILFLALGLLLALCLISAAFYPNDPSWNSAGQTETQNWAGSIGANVAATAFQFIGLAAYLLPLLAIRGSVATLSHEQHSQSLDANSWAHRACGCGGSVAIDLTTTSVVRRQCATRWSTGRSGRAGTRKRIEQRRRDSVAGGNRGNAACCSQPTSRSFDFTKSSLMRSVRVSHLSANFLSDSERGDNNGSNRRNCERKQKPRLKLSAKLRESALKQTLNLSPAERVADFMKEPVAPPAAGRPTGRYVLRQIALAPNRKPLRQSQQARVLELLFRRRQSSPNDPENDRSFRSPGSDVADDDDVEEMVKDASVVRVKAEAPAAGKLPFDATRRVDYNDYGLPPLEFLNEAPPHSEQADAELLGLATRLAEKCKEFNVTGQIKHICPGPVVTTYEFKPDPGVKYSRVVSLVDDLCLALKAESIRIDRMPGKPHVGIEVPNPRRETIFLREVIESRPFRESGSKLTIALGKTIDGLNYVADLAKMPHLLIAGTTGAGKSVGVNALIVSILYRARPDEVKFILIDPKRLELGLYEDIPHLATPIIIDPKLAARSLKWAVAEMERRYRDLAGWGVRNIDGYNTEIMRRNLIKEYDDKGEPWKPLPYIVIIIDELADLMMTSGREVEESITRLAQMARAVGIHLVLATQRPSVDVITGLIKANFPSRISFRVSSKVDSRTIIDTNGAEQLLGRGDMLFLPPGTSRLIRVHGAYIDETEIGRIVSHIKAQGPPAYDETITQSDEEALGLETTEGEHDELFEEALRICVEMKRASTSVLQRRLRIGYGRAAAILDIMEREGLIGQADGSRPRPVLGRAYEMVADWDEMAVSED